MQENQPAAQTAAKHNIFPHMAPYMSWIFLVLVGIDPVVSRPELSTGRMDPRVGSGRVGSGRVTILSDFGGSGQHFGFFSFLLITFLAPESTWIFEYCIQIDWFSTIFNI